MEAVATGVIVRKSGQPDGMYIKFSTEEWKDFITGVKNGDFDIV